MQQETLCGNISVDENGQLLFAGKNTIDLAKKYGTPLYLIDENMIRENIRTYIDAMKKYYSADSFPCFASKALSFKQIYRIMKEENAGIDVVSSGELYTALKAGFPLEKAFFHGNNKTEFDIEFAMDNSIGYFVVDNFWELDCIEAKAKEKGIVQKVLLRITPGIDSHTLEAINTGKVDSKFGCAIETGQAEEIAKYALGLSNVKLCGYHCHIGSQIFESKPFIDAAKIMLNFIVDIKEKYGYSAEILNLGGGFASRYLDSDETVDYAEIIKEIGRYLNETCENLGLDKPVIIHEPGRSIVASAGMTLYTVGTIKEIPGFKNYVSIDGGMADNPRYALYSAEYTCLSANNPSGEKDYKCSIAGRCCESGDMIAENIMLQKVKSGDILAVCTTGAYNYSMSSNYNRLPKPPVVMINEKEDYIAVKRETFDDIIRNDI